jgi:NDP-4-keto-2,6-dideoxyhexose 3-C-methyltransferase
MSHVTIRGCRICGNTQLHSVLYLGEQALTGVFPKSPDEPIPAGPVELVKCAEDRGGCGLVQLRQSYEAEAMYGQNYGYRSGLNQSMVQHLRRRAQAAQALARPQPGELILDIGSNDSTTLQAYPRSHELVGIDPTGVKFRRYYPAHIKLIPDFFTAKVFASHYPGRRAKIITSFAMFYDLEAPLAFMADIHEVLAEDGIWVFEQSYLPAMLRALAYDTICHEHLNYYALRQIKWLTDRAGFKILDVECNDINGGSFCVTVAKSTAAYQADPRPVEQFLAAEDRMGLSTLPLFEDFRTQVFRHRDELCAFLADARRQGRTVYGYGASTKGNVILQFCNLTAADVPAIAEVNEDKFGAYTPGTLIPIRSETEVRAARPDYLLVLPWHFKSGIVRREQAYLAGGGNLVFPLPSIAVVSQAKAKRAA